MIFFINWKIISIGYNELVMHWTPLSTLDLHTDKLERKNPWDRSTIEMTTIEVRSAN